MGGDVFVYGFWVDGEVVGVQFVVQFFVDQVDLVQVWLGWVLLYL